MLVKFLDIGKNLHFSCQINPDKRRTNMFLKFILISLLFICGVAVAKECTNYPTLLSSHTFRYELLKSRNETLKKEIFSHYHLTPTDDMAWSTLLPRKILKEEEDEYGWKMMYRKMKYPVGFKAASGNFLKEVPLQDVRLDPDSIHGRAQETNLEYLLMLDVDRLVWSFRKTAGFDTPGEPYGGWEAPNVELRGHFVGHYLSASAHMWASTRNGSLKGKMLSLVSALSACQEKIGTGYLSAFPAEFFDRFEAIKPVWAPYYTIHKILAGLLDQYKFAANNQALRMATWMAEYFYIRVRDVIATYTIERHWRSLNEETGGMNDVLYQLFSITKDSKHLLLASLFDKPCFIGLLAVQADDISGFHTNTHIPIVIGSQLRYEITGDPLYKEIGTFFMDIVNSSHSYATGGTSVNEFWSDPKRLATNLHTENEESCTTYNMLKVSRNLFRWTKEVAYADYYERALTNGVLGIQRGTEPGVMIYMLPLGHGVSKAASNHRWGTKFDSFWCCYGTGIESFSKLGDSIYFEEDGQSPGLYIIQYISSSINWKSGGVSLTQKVKPVVSWDPYLRVTFSLTSKQRKSRKSTLNIRIPVWTNSEGTKVTLNGQSLKVPAPGNFLSISQNWKSGDRISLEFPLSIRTEAIKDDRPDFSSLQAILYGPYLLAGHTTRDWSIGIQAKTGKWITPIAYLQNNYLITLSQESGDSTFMLTNSNQTITMKKSPEPGTDAAVRATFRLVTAEPSRETISGAEELIGKQVMLEPFDFPGMLVIHEASSNSLVVKSSSLSGKETTIFRLVSGIVGKLGTVSLELDSKKGCFVCSDSNLNEGTILRIKCDSSPSDENFAGAASFTMKKGVSQYHPMSFMVSGMERNFVLAPLMSFRDEFYNVYFNIQN